MKPFDLFAFVFLLVAIVVTTTSLLSIIMSFFTTFGLKFLYPKDWAIFKKEVVGPHRYNNPLIFRFSKAYFGKNTVFNPQISDEFLKLRYVLARAFLLNERIWKVSGIIIGIFVAIFFVIFNIWPEIIEK
ncbi:hypothetical protein GCM10017161_41280 [Thalassotalea marina]|uniref:Uncharacterized protein n=1 Tax=Thalassotalea marina TaxID=1673741 RepID=A0A919BSP3_9GAMM|nr:hypothetical protein GCM10017161_41280 [Thalassotalea marina]